jgi:hypothetical protein
MSPKGAERSASSGQKVRNIPALVAGVVHNGLDRVARRLIQSPPTLIECRNAPASSQHRLNRVSRRVRGVDGNYQYGARRGAASRALKTA